MRTEDYGFVQGVNTGKGQTMLETTQWLRVNNQCHVLADEDNRMLATVFTSYNEEDGDQHLIWDVEIEGDELGSYISLYSAKLAVQEAIRTWERKQEQKKVAAEKKDVPKKTTRKKKATTTKK